MITTAIVALILGMAAVNVALYSGAGLLIGVAIVWACNRLHHPVPSLARWLYVSAIAIAGLYFLAYWAFFSLGHHVLPMPPLPDWLPGYLPAWLRYLDTDKPSGIAAWGFLDTLSVELGVLLILPLFVIGAVLVMWKTISLTINALSQPLT